jgi:hypothetical protein
LCLGGNDFLPKYQGISHEKWISTVIDTPGTLTNLIKFTKESGKPISGNLNEEIYLNIVKKLYCPCNLQPDVLRVCQSLLISTFHVIFLDILEEIISPKTQYNRYIASTFQSKSFF